VSGFPRRNQVQKWVPAERAISDAVQAVEVMGADVRLTDAVILLGRAQGRVADFVDGVPNGEEFPRFAGSPGDEITAAVLAEGALDKPRDLLDLCEDVVNYGGLGKLEYVRLAALAIREAKRLKAGGAT
jgi:hypothetical protein